MSSSLSTQAKLIRQINSLLSTYATQPEGLHLYHQLVQRQAGGLASPSLSTDTMQPLRNNTFFPGKC